MAKYKGLPVEVEAFQITNVEPYDENDNLPLTLDNGSTVLCSPAMAARYIPKTGDFWVVQSDGYTYVNPQHVFLRKYEAAHE